MPEYIPQSTAATEAPSKTLTARQGNARNPPQKLSIANNWGLFKKSPLGDWDAAKTSQRTIGEGLGGNAENTAARTVLVLVTLGVLAGLGVIALLWYIWRKENINARARQRDEEANRGGAGDGEGGVPLETSRSPLPKKRLKSPTGHRLFPPKVGSMSSTSGRTSSPSGDARSPLASGSGTRSPQWTPTTGSGGSPTWQPSEPAAGHPCPLTTTRGPAAWAESIGDSSLPPTPAPAAAEAELELLFSSEELPSLSDGAPSSDFGAGEAEVAIEGAEGAPRHPSPFDDLAAAYDPEDLERQLAEFFDSAEAELRTSDAGPVEVPDEWANPEDEALRASVASPDQSSVTVDGGDNDLSGATLIGNDEGTGNTACLLDGYSLSVFPNGTIQYTPVARSQSDTVRSDADIKGPPGTASRGRKRSRKERQEEDREPEAEVVEVAPKRQRVQAPPLMPKDKFCLVFPQPAGFPWDQYLGVMIQSAEFFQEHLPVDSVEEAERMVKWWRQEWEDKASNLTYLMGLPWKTDPSGSARRLIRFAQPLCDRMREELGPEYYDRLMDLENKEFYGHLYFRMCRDVQALTEDKWRREEEAAIKARTAAAASVKQSRKRKDRGDDGEKDTPADSERKKQKGAKAPAQRLGNDGKIIRQRGKMRGAGKLQFQTEGEREEMEALQKRLLDEAAGR
ncbi:hypothetical protein TWF481_009144 [Arthrobotrys musiformis]|uniref:Uncharacterized protein n=1 Tax=Arthrobotrys musiformis TaxID=47236 RepID=A0AAV9W2S8_9PEZI